MAVPKRKTGRARTHARRSENDKIAAPSRSLCPECGEVKLPHRVCPNCGHYRDREVIKLLSSPTQFADCRSLGLLPRDFFV